MRDDFILEQKFGRELSFKVPQNYFNQFEKQLLENLPELPEKEVAPKTFISKYFRRIASVAACIAVIIVSSLIYFNNNIHNDLRSNVNVVNEHEISSVYADFVIDEYSDYALLDNDDFYSYVMDE
ncbi:MAG: hypothetical protein LUC91_01020 [Prevotella sp.]|nr:hypothetical protein [Prevotella sp.]